MFKMGERENGERILKRESNGMLTTVCARGRGKVVLGGSSFEGKPKQRTSRQSEKKGGREKKGLGGSLNFSGAVVGTGPKL